MALIQGDNRWRPRKKRKGHKSAYTPTNVRAKLERSQRAAGEVRTVSPSALDHLRPSQHVPSRDVDPLPERTARKRYDGDMAEREAAARAESARKAKCTAPAYNKGAYQYVATADQAKDIGR